MKLFSFLPVLGLVAASQMPLKDATSLSTSSGPSFSHSSDFTVLTHGDHPDHKISIKNHDSSDAVCDGATKGYSGYLSISDWKHFYFYYFDSRKDPVVDPLILWLNGGPGCSSMMGLFLELGPCRVNEHGNGTYSNPSSWIEEASVFFLDQPIGVGYSYADKGHGIEANGTFAASEDIYAFMQIWYKTFPESRSRPFHIAGESYGGHYIPIFAKHIVDENAKVKQEDTIPLESIMIGNGMFDPLRQLTSSWDITCTNVTGIGPILSETVCAEMSTHIPRCEKLWKAAYDYEDNLIGEVAKDYCWTNLEGPYERSGYNYYDVSKLCIGVMCYAEVDQIDKYLNSKFVRERLGIPEEFQRYEGCSEKVGRAYEAVGDMYYPTTGEVAALLNGGLRVLMYVGTYDWICNFVGNERWLDALEWRGRFGYRHAARYEQKPWMGGETWEYENLRYARVAGAGHMVPWDKPKEALHMVKAWLKNEKL